ncbi:MAG TPA: hypothetical protein VED40_04925 [Azospirillaceae bacterium]|nr:hypothetical protein [Azospirillaceae bacterium]
MSLLLPVRPPAVANAPATPVPPPVGLDGPFPEPELRPLSGPVRLLAWTAAALVPWTAIAALVALVW